MLWEAPRFSGESRHIFVEEFSGTLLPPVVSDDPDAISDAALRWLGDVLNGTPIEHVSGPAIEKAIRDYPGHITSATVDLRRVLGLDGTDVARVEMAIMDFEQILREYDERYDEDDRYAHKFTLDLLRRLVRP